MDSIKSKGAIEKVIDAIIDMEHGDVVKMQPLCDLLDNVYPYIKETGRFDIANEYRESFLDVALIMAGQRHPLNRDIPKLQRRVNNIISLWEMSEPQQVRASTPLPVELQTDEAIKRFERAEKAGIIERTQTGYRKKGITKAMLAYFLQKVYLQGSRASDLFPDRELSSLFGESRLGAAVTALVNNRDGRPKGHKQIDDLFVD